MAKLIPNSIFRYSEGLAFTSMVATVGGLAVVSYGIYQYCYYQYEITKKEKSKPQAGGVPGAGTPAAAA